MNVFNIEHLKSNMHGICLKHANRDRKWVYHQLLLQL